MMLVPNAGDLAACVVNPTQAGGLERSRPTIPRRLCLAPLLQCGHRAGAQQGVGLGRIAIFGDLLAVTEEGQGGLKLPAAGGLLAIAQRGMRRPCC